MLGLPDVTVYVARLDALLAGHANGCVRVIGRLLEDGWPTE